MTKSFATDSKPQQSNAAACLRSLDPSIDELCRILARILTRMQSGISATQPVSRKAAA